jgi:hypothetical protein
MNEAAPFRGLIHLEMLVSSRQINLAFSFSFPAAVAVAVAARLAGLTSFLGSAVGNRAVGPVHYTVSPQPMLQKAEKINPVGPSSRYTLGGSAQLIFGLLLFGLGSKKTHEEACPVGVSFRFVYIVYV